MLNHGLNNLFEKGDNMAQVIELEEKIWQQFSSAAKEEKKNPKRLLTELIQSYLEIREDEKLDKEIKIQAQKSQMDENEAVEFVSQYRNEKAK